MQFALPKNQAPLSVQVPLYLGIGLIIVSMLFLGRDTARLSFWAQAAAILAAPALFYGVGALVYRFLNAPLAAPGIVATGAWLIGVALIHLDSKRHMLDAALRDYYWVTASLIAATLITATAQRVNTRLLIPLAPLAQINALWAILGAVGVGVAWVPPLSFALVYVWWEYPFRQSLWSSAYRGAAVLFTLFLLIFNLWLPAATGDSRMAAWIAGAAVVGLIGARHGWRRLAPLAIVMLAVAVAWGMPKALWSPLWLLLASAAVIIIERLRGADDDKKGGAKAVELTEALAVTLSGIAAAFAALSPMFNAGMHPLGVTGVLAAAGGLLAWLGWRRSLRSATHLGLWLLASAWGLLYFVAAPESGTFGLWLALLASVALLLERVITSRARLKRKSTYTLIETVARWPLADLVIGLSTMILLWSALNFEVIPPMIVAVTLSLAVAIWVAAGMIYRLPALLHVALWVAPLPFGLLMMLAAPALWSLPLMGIAWQLLALIELLIGHFAPRYRPAMLAPFFIAGYGLMGIGWLLAMANPAFVPLSLGIVIVTSLGTSIAVLGDRHPAWLALVEQIAPYDTRPFAHHHIKSLFLFFSAWLMAAWLQLMLGYTALTLARQGVVLVVFAGLFFLVGRALERIPGAAAWTVTSAGWLLWGIGLLQVFFSPAEAIITLILGLALSGEAFTRSRSAAWLPAITLNVFVAALQIARLLALPSHALLLVLAVGVALGGAWYERKARSAGRIIAVTGGIIAVGIAALQLDSLSLVGMLVLAGGAAVLYREGGWLYVAFGIGGILLFPTDLLRLPFDQIGRVMMFDAVVMSGAAVITRVVAARFGARWWSAATLRLGGGLGVFGAAFALAALAYPHPLNRSVGLLSFGLLVALCVVIYWQTRKVGFLGLALIPMTIGWALIAPRCLHWFPVGLGLLVIGRQMRSRYFAVVEYAGAAALVLATFVETDLLNISLSEHWLTVVVILALLAYGIVGARRIPFALSGASVIGGLLAILGNINLWLIPLGGGILLIGAAVFIESQRETARQLGEIMRIQWLRLK